MLLYRIAGRWAAGEAGGDVRFLASDPLSTPPGRWTFEEPAGTPALRPQVPAQPSKIVGIGRNYRDHAAELGNPMPAEPLLFLKPPSSLVAHGEPILLPPESEQVEQEGEIAVVVGRRLRRAAREEAAAGILGITCACDVTARDLQGRDRTFARGKGFDTFCPLGPAILLGAPEGDLEVVTRVSGVERQRGRLSQMAWGLVDLLVYVSTYMTLEAGDVLLTGTPAGVAALVPGDLVEVEIAGVGALVNPVAALPPRRGRP